jgi:hypothetical protein
MVSCETGIVSRGILGLRASWQSLPAPPCGGRAAACACSHLALFLADCPERRFCSSASQYEDMHKTLGYRWGEALKIKEGLYGAGAS